ncbi:hypothetical protein [Ilyobacter polytropus]|uniref:AbiTii domain-containing protein n=1 Tax=Ilyobacter polytropus (strain ATCC 51220 / DSM 2926 / LMG 16218 / CuHBu1) TaxID=572544 RepID=E3H7D6_ILYPC|nr:hypothetical protein [Ilyobacter polytropus]ADO82832.1 conserved hypothetical protein [Ilyobacter polytropus DSM 2926]
MKSKLLLDLLENECELENILFRLKTILFSLENDEIIKWIDSEIEGYKEGDGVPEYRKVMLTPHISATDGVWSLNKAIASIGHLDKKELNAVLYHNITDSINSLSYDEKDTCISYNSFLTHRLGEGYSRKLLVTQAYGAMPLGTCSKIKSCVKNRLLSIILELEKKYGALNDYDIFLDISDTEKTEIGKTIINITMGNNNRITGSNFGVTKNEEN